MNDGGAKRDTRTPRKVNHQAIDVLADESSPSNLNAGRSGFLMTAAGATSTRNSQLSIAIRERLGLKPGEDIYVENEVLGLHRRFPQIPAAEIKGGAAATLPEIRAKDAHQPARLKVGWGNHGQRRAVAFDHRARNVPDPGYRAYRRCSPTLMSA